MIREKLIKNLEALGKPVATWKSPDGTRVLVLAYGGRVLGLFPPDDEENFFWTHTALNAVDSARQFYEGEQWHNSGGERTWLAPEVDFFFPEFPSLDHYWQQRELDPGHYQISRDHGTLSWKNRATLTLSRTKRRVDLEIIKSLAPAFNPLRHNQLAEWAGLRFAGYTLCTSLQLMGTEDHSPYVGLWSLTQMPHGGDMLIPTLFRSEPKIYMGKIDVEDLIVGEHLVRYKMRAAGEHKLGMRAVAVTGRVGYIYSHSGEASLVVRNFNINPSGEYVDVPWLEPDNFGFAFQACNVNSHLGAFSELEYHVPAIGANTGKFVSEDQSQLWAFRGPEPAVKSVAQHLLSAEA
ncbi:MAG: hypothetical protein JO185_25925 [Acidobacteriaceae bacterium]|nr:hypothetical protein [Acidobacteriaceae bacterium]